jgi:hypothetical protein
MQLKDIMLSVVNQAEKDKGHHVFSHMWKIGPKINIHKTKHDHTHYIDMFLIVELLYGTQERRERKRE